MKIPKYGTINPTDYNYFIIDDKVFLVNKETNFFETNENGDKIALHIKHYIELLKLDTQLKTLKTGQLLTTKKN